MHCAEKTRIQQKMICCIRVVSLLIRAFPRHHCSLLLFGFGADLAEGAGGLT